MPYYGVAPGHPTQQTNERKDAIDETNVGAMIWAQHLQRPGRRTAFKCKCKVVRCRVDILKAEDTPAKPTLKTGDLYIRRHLRYLNRSRRGLHAHLCSRSTERLADDGESGQRLAAQRMPAGTVTAYDRASQPLGGICQGIGNYDPAKQGPLALM
jgi:hypothetical protein